MEVNTEGGHPLRSAVAAIRAHFADHGHDDELAGLVDEMDEYVAAEPEPDAAHRKRIVDRIDDAVGRYEADHPQLVQALREGAYYLSGSGL